MDKFFLDRVDAVLAGDPYYKLIVSFFYIYKPCFPLHVMAKTVDVTIVFASSFAPKI